MSSANKITQIGLVTVEEGGPFPLYTLMVGNGNRISLGRTGLPPSGAYADGTNPIAGDQWWRTDSQITYFQIYICTVGGGSPTWEALQLLHIDAISYTNGAITITPDQANGPIHKLSNVLSGTLTINAPLNATDGEFMILAIQQDGTGGRQIVYNSSAFKSVVQPNLAPNAVSILPWLRSGGNWFPLVRPAIPIEVVNTTEVDATNPTSATNLMSFAFPTGALNGLGRLLRVRCWGTAITVGTPAPTLNIAIYLGGTPTLLSNAVSAALGVGTTNPWSFDLEAAVTTAGAAGVLQAHSRLIVQGAAYSETNGGATTTVDLTAADTLQVQCLMNQSNAGNVCKQFLMHVELMNAA